MYKKEPLPKEKHTNEELYRRQVETLKLLHKCDMRIRQLIQNAHRVSCLSNSERVA